MNGSMKNEKGGGVGLVGGGGEGLGEMRLMGGILKSEHKLGRTGPVEGSHRAWRGPCP